MGLIFSLQDDEMRKYVQFGNDIYKSLRISALELFEGLIKKSNETGNKQIQNSVYESLTKYKEKVLVGECVRGSFNNWLRSDKTIERLLKDYGIGTSAERWCLENENRIYANAEIDMRGMKVPEPMINNSGTIKEGIWEGIYKDCEKYKETLGQKVKIIANQIGQEKNEKVYESLNYLTELSYKKAAQGVDIIVEDIKYLEKCIDKTSDKNETTYGLDSECKKEIEELRNFFIELGLPFVNNIIREQIGVEIPNKASIIDVNKVLNMYSKHNRVYQAGEVDPETLKVWDCYISALDMLVSDYEKALLREKRRAERI